MSDETISSDGAAAKPIYDLEERTAKLGESIIAFAKKIPRTPITLPLITQLIKSSTSIGANYCEADDGVPRNDFRHRISICRKEAKESKFWLRMIATAAPELREESRQNWREVKELQLIFSRIYWKLRPEK